MRHDHVTRADVDAAYVAAMRDAIRSGEGKRAPKVGEVRAHIIGPVCWRCTARIITILPALHRLHGVRT